MSDLIVVDGNSLMNRAFYGIPLLKNSSGIYTNAVYGFLNILLKLIEEEKPSFAAVAFDVKKPTFRHERYDEYKAGRKGMPDELAAQMPIIKEVLGVMGIKIVERPGFEADDILGVLSKQADDMGIKTTILTGDRDSLQLISSLTTVKLPTTKNGSAILNLFNYEEFINIYGIEPHEFIDVKALMGDSSDNIPGVPAIGEKTAIKLISTYKSLDNIYSNIEEVSVSQKIKNNLIEYKEQAYLSRELATIVRILDDVALNDCKYNGYENNEIYEIFKKLEFNSLINRLGLEQNGSKANQNNNEQAIELKYNLDENIYNEFIQNESLYYMIIYNKDEIENILLKSENDVIALNIEKDIENIKRIFEDERIGKIGFDIKKDILNLKKIKIDMKNIKFDIMIAAYVLDSSSNNYEISILSNKYLGIELPSIKETENSDSETKINNFSKYLNVFEKLYIDFNKHIQENDEQKLFYEIEMPLVETLAGMELEGFKVDLEYINSFGIELNKKIADIQTKIYAIAGEEFNLNSPKQLGPILFEKLGLPVKGKAKTKTGYSTNIEVLNELKDDYEIVAIIINYRQLAKLKSTYVDGIKNSTGEDLKIHSNFNQTVVTTGRISSTDPNLQNIPIKLEMGKLIRKAFLPSDSEHILIDADYSQIELRVLADLSGDEHLIQAFKEGQDIHAITAAKIFGVDLNEVTSYMRSSAKAVNFGIVYGISDFGLAKDLSITKKEAKKYIDSYFEKYPKIRDFMDKTIAYAEENEFVATSFNRRRYIPEIKSRNFMVRSGAHRIAMNTPVQGTAADIIKIAMVNVDKRLKKEGMSSKLILQVHDELIIDTLKSEKDKVRTILKEEMENAVSLMVPLIADINEGENWYETK